MDNTSSHPICPRWFAELYRDNVPGYEHLAISDFPESVDSDSESVSSVSSSGVE